MKLRNKKTGEIYEIVFCPLKEEWKETDENRLLVIRDCNKPWKKNIYKSLAELNEDWEDYEEPKEYYYLNEYLELDHEMWTDTEFDNKLKDLGNYFETKEEAEKAVEKLKAWKRLKDKGFKFRGLGVDHYEIDDIKYEMEEPPTSHDCQEMKDLKLLFGGEE